MCNKPFARGTNLSMTGLELISRNGQLEHRTRGAARLPCWEIHHYFLFVSFSTSSD